MNRKATKFHNFLVLNATKLRNFVVPSATKLRNFVGMKMGIKRKISLFFSHNSFRTKTRKLAYNFARNHYIIITLRHISQEQEQQVNNMKYPKNSLSLFKIEIKASSSSFFLQLVFACSANKMLASSQDWKTTFVSTCHNPATFPPPYSRTSHRPRQYVVSLLSVFC